MVKYFSKFRSSKSNFIRRKLLFESLEGRRVLTGSVLISEFLASNSDGLTDEDGDSSDWIELYNPSSTAVNLAGWKLTDRAEDLNQWQFPTVTIGPNEYLLVFASGKNRAVAGQQLHTNFRLSSDGEYLALVNPSNNIVSHFSPAFPQQATNVSYGPRFATQALVGVGSSAKTLIPSNGSLGNTWQSPSFNDSAWHSTPVGIGFGVNEPGFSVTYYKANIQVGDLSTALAVIANPSLVTQQVSERVPVINYLGNGGGGNFGSDRPFPTQQIGQDYNDFVIRATGSILVPFSGNWTFGVNSDDGFRLTLSRNGMNYVSDYPWNRAPNDTLSTFNLPQAGIYEVELVMYERAGGASVELFATNGSVSSFNSSFRLVGDTSSGGLSAFTGLPAGPSSPLRTDISGIMQGVNSSAYVRIPFQLSSVNDVQSLTFRIRYNDGFVAYLNGVEVARRNAPATVSFNSAATSARSMEQTLQFEQISLTNFISALAVGTNVLSIHGLNFSASDSSFLIIPELNASSVFVSDLRYFAQPTPGEANGQPFLGLVQQPTFSVPAGFYDTQQTVTLTTNRPTATIRYTLDGSMPTLTNGMIYTAPIQVNQTTTIRAIAYETNYVTLPSRTRTYLFVNDIIHQSANGSPPPGWPSSWGSNVVDYGMDPRIINWEGAEVVKNALKAIPSLNIAIDLPHLFNPTTGIYANAWQDGRDWERPASLELINPNGTPGFQVNAGLRIRGGYSRSPENPKHAFRLFFRGEYGDSSLEYPIAGPGATSSFKKIDLRTAQNYSWSFGGDPSNNFVAEVYNRLSQQAMGMPSTSSQWYHLYLNGQYWGLYQTQERAEHEFAATYFGGLANNYDVIKAEAGPYNIYATSGNLDAWQQLWTSLSQNIPGTSIPLVSDNSEYLRLQGKNPNGSNNPNYPVLLDVDNLAVYMIGILFGGNLDAPISAFLGNNRVNNFYAIRDRTGREGFKFFQHDGEHTLRNVNENRNGPWPAGSEFQYSNPQWFHQRLMANAEYRMRFADLVQKHLFNGGALTVAANQSRFLGEAAKIDQAIYAESARWGDAKRPNDPLRRSHWLNAVNDVVNNYFPARPNVVINQFRNTTLDGTTLARLFPTLNAPGFIVNGQAQHGGLIPPNSQLRFSSAPGTVYYTLDGSDPRLWGDGINPNALSYIPGTSTQGLFSANSSWKYYDQGGDLGTAWRNPSYNDSSWSTGNGEFGYGDGDETTVVSYGPNPNNKHVTTYFRKNFQVTNLSQITGLSLQLKRDDGAVVYINGVEAARSNMPSDTITASTLASSVVAGSDESTFYQFDLNPSLLVEGNNLIAVEVHQVSPSSSDLSFDAALSVTRQTAPAIPMGVLPTIYRARTRSPSGEWSALIEATFTTPLTPANESNLIVTEVHYNPAPFPGGSQPPLNDAQSFEFLELRNISNDVILLDGVSFSGITYTFPTSQQGPQTWLLPGELAVVVKNQTAFAARYLQPGSPYLGIKIAPGDYGTSNLSNGGETITVFAANQSVIQSFTYDDQGGWPTSPDGQGFSLTPIRMQKNLYSNPSNWRASFVLHGTPGIEENDPPTANAGGPYSALPGQNLTLSGSGFDPDWGQTLTYEWDLQYDGTAFDVDVIGATPTINLSQAFPARTIALRVRDNGTPSLSHIATTTLTINSQIEGTYVYHRDSQFSGGGNVAAALDTTKTLALQTATPQTLSFNNLINSSRGINGLVFDINKLRVSNLTSADFEFRMSPHGAFNELANPPQLWQAAPAPSAIVVQPGAVDRVILEWPNGSISNRWLRVSVLANSRTGLTAPQVYYVGHLLGETTGPADGFYTVSFADITPIRGSVGQAANPGSIHDIDKNGTVAFADISAMRAGVGAQLSNITVSSGGSGGGGGSFSEIRSGGGNPAVPPQPGNSVFGSFESVFADAFTAEFSALSRISSLVEPWHLQEITKADRQEFLFPDEVNRLPIEKVTGPQRVNSRWRLLSDAKRQLDGSATRQAFGRLADRIEAVDRFFEMMENHFESSQNE